jgi:cytochrome c oxidase subunit III
MKGPVVFVRKEELTVLPVDSQAPLWWGMILLLTIESAVFGTLIASYLYLRFNSPAWPPGEIEPPELLLPTITSLVLFASSLLVWWADRGLKKGDVARLKLGLGVSLALGMVFLALKTYEYMDADYRWDTHAYGSIVWTIIVFHSAHVATVVMKGCVMEFLAFRGFFTEEQRLGIDINGIYWHFVALIWIPLYVTIYLVPRI